MKLDRRTVFMAISEAKLPNSDDTIRSAIVRQANGQLALEVDKVLVPSWFYDVWVAAVGFKENEKTPIILGWPIEGHDLDEIKVIFKEEKRA